MMPFDIQERFVFPFTSGFSLGINAMPKWTIFEFQRGLLYDKGKFARELEPGFYRYWFWRRQSITVVDMRETSQTIEAQEILTADKIGIRVTLIAQYQVVDATMAIHSTTVGSHSGNCSSGVTVLATSTTSQPSAR